MKKNTENTSADSHQRLRTYPRIVLLEPSADYSALPNVFVVWQGTHENLAVYDLSFNGLAFKKPKNYNPTSGKQVSLILTVEEQSLRIEAEEVRANGTLMAVRILALGPASRAFFTDFLKDKLIGFHLQRIDPAYYDSHQGFSDWYHGPHDTDIFLWRGRKNEIENYEAHFKGTKFIRKDGKTTFEAASQNMTILKFAENFLEMLTQVFDKYSELRNFSEQIADDLSHFNI